MPPYWDNKALPTPTLTLPDTLFSTFWLFPSFLLKINAFPMRYEIWKERKKVRQKAGSNSGRSRQKAYALPSMPLTLMLKCLFLVLTIPISLVGRVSVNSLCQQGGLFALSVNRHSLINQHIRMICEGSCDTEDWNNDAENSALHHRNKLYFKVY